jgi:hypothetical protein
MVQFSSPHDKLIRVVGFRWDEGQLITLGFGLQLVPTLPFAKLRFNMYATDWDQLPATGPPFYTASDSWMEFVTQTRFMFAEHFVSRSGIYNHATGGWPITVDDTTETPYTFTRIYNPDDKKWNATLEEPEGPMAVTSQPVIHNDVLTATGIAASIGSNARNYWPQAEWLDVTTGKPVIPDGYDHVIIAPRDENDPEDPMTPFRSKLSVQCRGRGISIVDTGFSSGLAGRLDTSAEGSQSKAWQSLDGTMGFDPGGGPLLANGNRLNASGTFADKTIDFKSLRLVQRDFPGGPIERRWKAIGVAHKPHRFPGENGEAEAQFGGTSRPCGTMWILMEPVFGEFE